jgi:hypothetical protein
MVEKRTACRVLVGNAEGKRPLETPRHRWGNIIKMDLREIVGIGLIWLRMRTIAGLF